jgi:hypothetical protein
VYVHGFVEGKVCTPQKVLVHSRTTTQALPGLSAVYILLVGHFPYYESPDLTLIKAS